MQIISFLNLTYYLNYLFIYKYAYSMQVKYLTYPNNLLIYSWHQQ